MLAPTGNMDRVYRALQQQQRAAVRREARSAAKRITKEARQSAPLFMEIGEDSSAHWYLVYPFPGDDLRALRWLGRRRFGSFRPMQQRRHAKNEAVRLQGWQPMFPGWLFVRVFDIDKMIGRLLACPGVMSILRDPATQRPVPISDQFVDDVRAEGWNYNENAPHARAFSQHGPHRHRKRRPRPGRRLRKAVQELKQVLHTAEQKLLTESAA